MNRWSAILSALDTPGSIVLTSHVNPDGDALGSELALAAWLRRRGRTVHIVNADAPGTRYAFLDPRGECEVYEPARHDSLIAAAAVLVILDVSRWDRLGLPGDAFARAAAVRICIDHHVVDGEVPVDHALVDTSAAATGELIFDLIETSGDTVSAAMALPLYVAVMTDTGSFRYANTTPATHRIVAELLRFPIETAEVYEQVYGTSSEARLRLMGEVLSGMEVHAGGALVLLSVTREAVARSGAAPSDIEGFAELGRTLETCRAAAVLTEQAGGRVKVSLRSRGTVDIGPAARALGGGGHPQAAGAVLEGSLTEVRARVTAALTSLLESGASPGTA